jgi:hypothetical protein
MAVVLGMMPGLAAAQEWNETGDAGDLPATAQIPIGNGSLTAITGTLLPGGDADLFLIHISDPAAFTATTCAGGGVDSQLWLFALDGDGITFDDDSPECGVASTISGDHVTSAGLYYVACSAYDWDALDAQGREIWLDAPYDQERSPDGPGQPGPVAAWGETAHEQGAYVIELLGVSWPPIGIADLPSPKVAGVTLHANFPNPFTRSTMIRYEIGESVHVRLSVYDAQGRHVRLLIAGLQAGPAVYRVVWDGRDDAGRGVAAGTYFYRLKGGSSTHVRRMTLLP